MEVVISLRDLSGKSPPALSADEKITSNVAAPLDHSTSDSDVTNSMVGDGP